MKSKFALVGLLMLGACASNTTQNLVNTCNGATTAMKAVKVFVDDGTISERNKLLRIKAATDSIVAICTNKEFVMEPNLPAALTLVASQAAYLTAVLTEIE
jgi:hypothetical protein